MSQKTFCALVCDLQKRLHLGNPDLSQRGPSFDGFSRVADDDPDFGVLADRAGVGC